MSLNYYLSVFAVLTLLSCSSSNNTKDNQEVEISTVKIGEREWATTNLDVTQFRNGDTIPEARTREEWSAAWRASKPAWCYLDNDSRNGKIYGKIYNSFAMADPRGLAPEGFHIATFNEWFELAKYLGPETCGIKMKGKQGWTSKATNESQFNALPGACRSAGLNPFGNRNDYILWWSEWPLDMPFKQMQKHFVFRLGDSYDVLSYEKLDSDVGCYVRCVKDTI